MTKSILIELESAGEDCFTVFNSGREAIKTFFDRRSELVADGSKYDTPIDSLVDLFDCMHQVNPYIRLGIKNVEVDVDTSVYWLVVGFDKTDDIIYISAHPTEEEANKKIVSVTRELAAKYKDDKFLKRTSAEIIFNENTIKNGTDYIVFETFRTEEVNR